MIGRINKKHILVSVLGLTPQVITETIYYFCKIRKQPIKEVHVITTQLGKERIISSLFESKIVNELKNKLNADFKFEMDSIYVIHDKLGNPLKDIRTIEDNENVAEIIWKVLEEQTNRDDTIVHCSVAGGRKTMGVYAALAMSFLGRREDTLSHILVDEEKESSDFYYPLSEADESKLNLVEIPYIRLREILNIREKKINFVKRIMDYQKELDERFIPKKVIIDYENKIIDGGRSGKIKFPEREFFLYSLLAEKRRQCSCKNGCPECFLDIQKIIGRVKVHYDEFGRYFSKEIEDDKIYIYEIVSRINARIEKADIFRRDFFKVQKRGTLKSLRYGLSIPPDKIKPKL